MPCNLVVDTLKNTCRVIPGAFGPRLEVIAVAINPGAVKLQQGRRKRREYLFCLNAIFFVVFFSYVLRRAPDKICSIVGKDAIMSSGFGEVEDSADEVASEVVIMTDGVLPDSIPILSVRSNAVSIIMTFRSDSAIGSSARLRHASPRFLMVLMYRCDREWLQNTTKGLRMPVAMLSCCVQRVESINCVVKHHIQRTYRNVDSLPSAVLHQVPN